MSIKEPEKSEFEDKLATIPGSTWIEKLRFAFNEVDIHHSGLVSLDQWMKSRLRYLISRKPLNDVQMKETFNLIDFNCDMSIEWNELVDYLMTHDTGIDTQNVEKKLKISYAAPNEAIMQKSHRKNPHFKILFLSAQDEFVTLSEKTMTFWKREDCDPIRSFSDDHEFCDFCELKCLSKIAIAKSNRQIIFYDIRAHVKIDFVISASLDPGDIPKMSFIESKNLVVGHGYRRIPLFNTPTAIISHLDQPILIIGDDDGNIELYQLITSGSAKIDWSCQRLQHVKLHNDCVSQIMYLPDNQAYVSSSYDGTFVIWRYTHKDNKLVQAYKIKINNDLQILSFVYDIRTHDIVFTTSSHYFGIWRAFTSHQEIIETKSEIYQTLAIIPFSEDTSFCVAISKKNSIGLYRMPNLDIIDSHYLGLQHELCPPASAFVMRDDLYLAGAFLSRYTIKNSTNEDLLAHKHPLVGVLTNDVFGRVLSFDQHGDFSSWDITSGRKICTVSLNELDSYVLCAEQDPQGRRIALGYSNGLVKIISSNSGTELCKIEKRFIEGSCNYVMFAQIFSSNKIICCSSSRIAVLFDDISGNRTNFVRRFTGHAEPLSRCAVVKGKFVITIGSDREMFLWNIQMQNPVTKYQLPNDPTIALDLPNDDSFIVGDVQGCIHMMKLDSPTPISTFNGIGLTVRSPVTSLIISNSMSALIVGNFHGYIKTWDLQKDSITEKIKFVDKKRFRAHPQSILSIGLSDDYFVVVSAGRDEEIKLWSLEPFGLIGQLGKAEKFLLEDKGTWESNEALPEDPIHFMDATQTEKAIGEREKLYSSFKNREKEEVQHPHEQERDENGEFKVRMPTYSIEAVNDMYNTLESQCITGRKYARLAALSKEDLPKKPQPPSAVDRIELVDDDMCLKTIAMYDKAISRPRIWKPKGKI